MYSGSRFYRSSKLMLLSRSFCLSDSSAKLYYCDSCSRSSNCSADISIVFPSLSTSFKILDMSYSSSSGIGSAFIKSAYSFIYFLLIDEATDIFDNLDRTEALSKFLLPSWFFKASKPARPLPDVSFILPLTFPRTSTNFFLLP